MRSASAWAVAASGTRYIKNPVPPKPVREDPDAVSIQLKNWLTAEGNKGDLQLAVVFAVRNLIRRESHWTNKARALNREGSITEPTSSDAKRWNINGALLYVTHTFMNQKQRREIIDMMKTCLPGGCRGMALFQWEETARHSQVLHLLNMTIAARKAALGY